MIYKHKIELKHYKYNFMYIYIPQFLAAQKFPPSIAGVR